MISLRYQKALLSSLRRSIYLKVLSRKNPYSQVDREDISQTLLKLKSVGYHVIPDYLQREECDHLKAEVDKLFEVYKQYLWVDDKDSDLRLFAAERASNDILHFCQDQRLLHIRNSYFDALLDNSNTFTLANKVEFKHNNLGSGGGWHRDLIYGKIFKSILYLSDVDDENGPFQYIEKTHRERSKLRLVRKAGFEGLQNRISEDQVKRVEKLGYEIRSLLGKAGTLILADTSGIHRGKPIEKGSRYALTNYYSLDPYPEHISKYFAPRI